MYAFVANFAARIEIPSKLLAVRPCIDKNAVNIVKLTIKTVMVADLKKEVSFVSRTLFDKLSTTENTVVQIKSGKIIFETISIIPPERSAIDG